MPGTHCIKHKVDLVISHSKVIFTVVRNVDYIGLDWAVSLNLKLCVNRRCWGDIYE